MQICHRSPGSAKETRDKRKDKMWCDPGKVADPGEKVSIARRF